MAVRRTSFRRAAEFGEFSLTGDELAMLVGISTGSGLAPKLYKARSHRGVRSDRTSEAIGRFGHRTLSLLGNLPEAANSLKSEFGHACGYAVQNVSFLWKDEEN